MQLVRPLLCVSPETHALQRPFVPAVPAAHSSHAPWSAIGVEPALHGTHAVPSLLNEPAGHCSQPSAAPFGCWPGEHVEHDCMSRAPPVSSLWRWVPFTHAIQCVAPMPNEIVSGSEPRGQYWQSKPTAEILPGGHTSHTVCSTFGDRPAAHASHDTPVPETHPRVLSKIAESVQTTQLSAMTARDTASIRGCVPSAHCEQSPLSPACPTGHGWHAEAMAFGISPSAQAMQLT